MDLNKYQERALTTAIYPESIKAIFKDLEHTEGVAEATMLLRLNYAALGLAGEAGEFANKVKKLTRDRTGLAANAFLSEDPRISMALELGDALWYVADAARELGYTLEDIANMNLRRLNKRKEEGKIEGSGDDR